MSLSSRLPFVHYPNLTSAVKLFQSSCSKYAVAAATSAPNTVNMPINVTMRAPMFDSPVVNSNLRSSNVLPKSPSLSSSSIKSSSVIDVTESDSVDESSTILPSDAASHEVGTVELMANTVEEKVLKEVKPLFTDRTLSAESTTVVTICLRTELNMGEWSMSIEAEREELLASFIQSGIAICQALRSCDFWADFIDPSCGKPYLSSAPTNSTLFETDYLMSRLSGGRLSILDLGCCRVVEHALWGTHAYVGVLFTDAPRDHPLLAQMKL